MNRKKASMTPYLVLIVAIVVISLYRLFFLGSNDVRISVDDLVKVVRSDIVSSVVTKGEDVYITTKDGKKYSSILPEEFKTVFYQTYLKEKVESGKLTYSAEKEKDYSYIVSFIPTLMVLIVLGFFWYMIIARSSNANSQAMKFGKSRASFHIDKNNSITFKDVAGLKEEKEEMGELVDFLKNPKKYIQHGARIPKGVLLVGQPGTGKTYISKAVAGEAKVPFYSISGSNFVEMFVGVGASRVRDMFKEAKKNAPCIIFIDEIDAVGRKRGSGLGGGHDEREQTLNQLLVEMDGFTKNEGIIIIAATNRPDILDPALLRPGRFDRTITISIPDVREREEILRIHTNNKILGEDVDITDLAKSTSGFSPAELENMTNEAALLAARSGDSQIDMKTFQEALIRTIAGPEKKSRVVVEKERILTAYHEAGHAVTSEVIKSVDPVHIITIIPRGYAGGFTAYLPDEDKNFTTKTEMEKKIIELLGGRAAEEIVLGEISTGASNDIERATKIARSMVKTFGFSEILGPVKYDDESGNVFLGGTNYSSGDHYSDKTAVLIDEEVTKLLKDSYKKAKNIIIENREFLEELTQTLLKDETIRRDKYVEIAQKYIKVEENIN